MKTAITILLIVLQAGLAFSNWESLNSGVSDNLFGIDFYDSQNGIAAGWGASNGVVLRTSDGGDTWTQQIPLAGAYLFGVNYKNQDEIFIAGSDAGGSFTGLVLRSQNSGESWAWSMHSSSWGFYVVDFPTAEIGFTCGYQGAIYRTQNGGDTWQLRGTGTQLIFRSMHFPTAEIGFAVGGSDFLSPNTIYRTENSAEDWSLRYSFASSMTVGGIHFLNENEGIVVGGGNNESIKRSVDGGQNWTEVYTGPNNGILQALWMEGAEGWAVGNGGRAVHTVDGGQSWVLENDGIPQSADLLNVCRGGEWVYACGSNGILYRLESPLTVPGLGINNLEIIGDDNEDGRPDAGETVELELILENSTAGVGAVSISVSLDIESDDLTVINGELTYPDAPPGAIVAPDDSFVFTVAEDIQPFDATLLFTITADYEGGTLEIQRERTLRIGRPDLLVVDSDGGLDDNEFFLTDILDQRNTLYDLLEGNDEALSEEEMLRYPRIFWLGGVNENDLPENQLTGLAGFLDGGGQLLLSSQYMSDQESSENFLSDYFGTTVVDTDLASEFVVGCDTEDGVFSGSAFVLSGTGGANNLEEPDALECDNGFGFWMYSGLVAAVLTDNQDYKAIFCGFPVEAMRVHASVEGSLDMDAFLDLLEIYFNATSLEEPLVLLEPDFKITSVFPNPFNPQATVTMEFARPATVELEIFNSLGQLVKSRSLGYMDRGQHLVTFDASGISSGIYHICLSRGGQLLASKKAMYIR